jgi:ubiquitin carboxyl-terminal hydrolase 22/27/51
LAGYQQQDAHEYLQFLLNQLHVTNGGNSDTKTEPCKCIIHRAFYGKLQSDVTCEGCQNVTTAVDPVMDLSLDLRIKDKKKPDGFKIDKEQTLQECLERFTSAEKLGMNEYNCSNCSGQREVATKQLSVKRLPPVLCIQLKVG